MLRIKSINGLTQGPPLLFLCCLIFVLPAFAQNQRETSGSVNSQVNSDEVSRNPLGFDNVSQDMEKKFTGEQVDAQKEFNSQNVDAQKEFHGPTVDAQKEFHGLTVDAQKEFSGS